MAPTLRLVSLAAVLAWVSVPQPARADSPRFGVQMDVGVPSGAGGSVVYRPVRALRLHAGGGHNAIGPGVQAGVSLVPLGTRLAPTLMVDAGRFFAADASAVVERLSGEPSSATMRFGYDFASAHLGLELGSEWLTFYLHGGVSYVRANLGGADTSDDGSVSTMSEVDVDAVGVSARLGFIIYLAK